MIEGSLLTFGDPGGGVETQAVESRNKKVSVSKMKEGAE